MKRYFWGAVFILLGVLSLLQGVGFQNYGLRGWPVFMTLVGAAIVLESLTKRRGPQWFGLALGLWLGAYGLFDILYEAGLTGIQGGDILRHGWPILLIAMGFSIFFGRGIQVIVAPELKVRKNRHQGHQHVVADLYYGRENWVLEQDLTVNNGVGDLKLDLTTAEITPGTHRITVVQFAGETVIRVPDDVTVRVTAEANAGELEIFGEQQTGVSLRVEREVVVADSLVELIIDATQRVGSLKVKRVPVKTRVIG